MARHGGGGFGGGGGGGMHDNPTAMYGTSSAIVPFVAAWLFITMPLRWPVAFRMVLLCALPLAILTNGRSLSSLVVLVPLLYLGWYISRTYMTHEHYRPAKGRRNVRQIEADHLAQYAHLRSPEAWRAHNQKEQGK